MIIAVASENEEVFQHFGHTPEFTIFEIESGSVKNKQAVSTAKATALWRSSCWITAWIC